MAGSTSGTFQAAIDEINNLATKTAPLASKVDRVNDALDSLNHFLGRIQDLKSDLDDVTRAISDVNSVCAALEPVPVVGEITNIVSDALTVANDAIKTASDPIDSFVNDVVSPAQNLIGTLKSGVGKVDDALHAISTDVPMFTNTLSVLQSLATIADSLVAALAGTDLATRLAVLEADYKALRKDIDAGTASIDNVIDALGNAVDTVSEAIDATASIAASVESAIGSVGSVTGILDPVKSALETVENAIAPVKWALDAVSCIVDKVLKPVIDEVLDFTGLSGLANKLSGELSSALGISAVTDGLKNALHLQVLQDFANQIEGASGSAAGTFLQGWDGVRGTLEKYKSGDQARDEAIKQFVDVISGAPAGTDPGVVPEWPMPSNPYVPPADVPVKPSPYKVQFTLINAAIAVLNSPPTRLLAATPSTNTSNVLSTTLPPLGTQWKDVTTLQDSIAHELDAIAGFMATPTALCSRYAAFEQTFGLSDAMSDQLGDITISLKMSSDLIKAVDGFALINNFFSSIDAALDDQLKFCSQGSAAITQLRGNVDKVSDSLKPVIAATPSRSLLSDASSRLAGWARGAEMLARSIDLGRTMKQTPTSLSDLDAKTAQLNGRCAELAANVQAIEKAITTSAQQAALIDKQLQVFGQALSQIGKHGEVMSDQGQATADQMAHLASVIDSLINPLSLIAQQMNCTATAPVKNDAHSALQTLSVCAVTGSKNAASGMEKLLDDVFAKVLPIDALTRDAVQANNVLTDAMAAQFRDAAGLLDGAMKDLTTQLKNTYSYSFLPKSGPAPAPIANQFLNQTTGDRAIALSQSLSA